MRATQGMRSVALLATLCVCSASTHAKPRPNILMLMADEMDGRIFDPASPQLKPPMPNLNALGAAGALFTTAYNQAAQCVPSRSAMMVGLRTDQIEVYDNAFGGIAVNGDASTPDNYCVKGYNLSYCKAVSASRPASPKTFIDRLSDGGYGINLYGKMHAGWGLDRYPGALYDFPFGSGSQKINREWTRGLGPATNIKGSEQDSKAKDPPDSKKKPAKKDDYKAMESCVSQLQSGLFNSPSPQFLYCSLLVPHPPYASNHTFMKAVANLTIGVPEWVPKASVHPNDFATSFLKGTWLADDFKAKDIVYFRNVYFSMCYEADVMLGEIINALDASGARANTYVIMVSDHGEDNYEHRQLGKNNMYDSGSRVAMLLSGPGVSSHQQITDLTSLNDMYPTILDMAGVTDLPSDLAGSSLLPLVDSSKHHEAGARRDYVVAQYHSVFSTTGQFMVRQGDYKLITFGKIKYGSDYPAQLFNLVADPWELHDIASANPDIVKKLDALLRTEVDIETVDERAKATTRQWFMDLVWEGSDHCQETFQGIYKDALNSTDAKTISSWAGQPCPWQD